MPPKALHHPVVERTLLYAAVIGAVTSLLQAWFLLPYKQQIIEKNIQSLEVRQAFSTDKLQTIQETLIKLQVDMQYTRQSVEELTRSRKP